MSEISCSQNRASSVCSWSVLLMSQIIGVAFGFWTHSLEMDEWSGFSWFKPGM